MQLGTINPKGKSFSSSETVLEVNTDRSQMEVNIEVASAIDKC